jgi:ABC-type uncharacterized transport system substrate-binding protein
VNMNKAERMAHRAMGMEQQRRVIRNNFSLALGALVFALSSSAGAQQPARVPRIGFLSATSPTIIASRVAAFRQGLGDLGYVESKNILTEYRFAQGNLERLRKLAAELVGLKLDAIVTAGPTVTRPVKEATSTIPIIMAFDDDPVGSGYAASLARPGGNITGLSILAPEISGKQLELLKEIIPKLSRVAVFGSSTRSGTAQALKETEAAAGSLGVQLQYLDILGTKDVEIAVREAMKARAEAVLVLQSAVMNAHRKQIADLAAKSRLPAIYNVAEFVDAGGLMTYGVSITDLHRRAATYVDKILKGAKPRELPTDRAADQV